MEHCLGCLRVLFGSRQRRQKLRYLINYRDGENGQMGVEFENLMLTETQTNYGTDIQFISNEERDYISRREYDRIVEEQKKVDEQIQKQLFEEEELLRIEEEAYYEAQREAAKATLSTKSFEDKLFDSSKTATDDNSSNLTHDDDYEGFLEEAHLRSVFFHSKHSNNIADETSSYKNQLSFNRDGDGQSDDEEFVGAETSLKQPKDESSANHSTAKTTLEKRLEPLGDGSNCRKGGNLSTHNEDDRLAASQRMFSITGDEDMGEFVHA